MCRIECGSWFTHCAITVRTYVESVSSSAGVWRAGICSTGVSLTFQGACAVAGVGRLGPWVYCTSVFIHPMNTFLKPKDTVAEDHHFLYTCSWSLARKGYEPKGSRWYGRERRERSVCICSGPDSYSGIGICAPPWIGKGSLGWGYHFILRTNFSPQV